MDSYILFPLFSRDLKLNYLLSRYSKSCFLKIMGGFINFNLDLSASVIIVANPRLFPKINVTCHTD